MFEKLYSAIIYSDEFKKILLGRGVDDLEIASAYIAFLYEDLPIIGKNLCAAFLRMGLDAVYNVMPSGKVYSPRHKLYPISRYGIDGVCINCDGGKIILRISNKGYDPEDLLESKGLESRIFVSKNFKKKSMEIIEKIWDVNKIRLIARKEILERISAGGILHMIR
ncbi:hypothetical protein SULI_05150 [Saccharolobus solfataricus]|uniref:Uncharacterized protein n=3 Tax=Saccharolobus solfataricus TaxID=2287 RepID=Q981B4_SACS2|nr:hypothetical protein [Saccharolobus solfataricus]AAK40398.1 Hypothetical protein SSO0033 [Saccharolobus solfataricus P2]AKA73391.1 hypothetical protein SULB_1050 [Saccharolobus solfataricus]AKA76090.1 hypothetical protein SULC_1049 [Saccharolobus solfataricus]AKA78782.1 hypothetical protein SULA_1048 [Saccharolobus solfataricus]AZF67859.1 hypothetical protein SULG_05150 [Saccharolobus solfataricus]